MTQVIERVARAMFEAGPIDATWEQANEFVGEVLRTYAQAALEEIKFDELVGALKVLLGDFDPEVMGLLVGGVASCPECTVGTVPNDKNEGLCAWHKLQALLSELEKTE